MSTKKMIALVVVVIAGLAGVAVPATAQPPAPEPGGDFGGYVEETDEGPVFHRATAEDVQMYQRRIDQLNRYIAAAAPIRDSMTAQIQELRRVEANPEHSPGVRRYAFGHMEEARAERARLNFRLSTARRALNWLAVNVNSPNRPLPPGNIGPPMHLAGTSWTEELAESTVGYMERQDFVDGTDVTGDLVQECLAYCQGNG